MKDISVYDLKKMISEGGEIDGIDDREDTVDEILLRVIRKSSEDNSKAIKSLVGVMSVFLNAQSKDNKKLADRLSTMSDPKDIKIEFPKDSVKKKKWKFNVQREHRGFITNIIAEEI